MSANAFHEKAGRSQVDSFVFSLDRVSPAESPLSPPFHPHSLRSDFVRSVQVGCSRYSRCCHLIFDLSSISRWRWGQAFDAVTGTRLWAFAFPFCFCFSFSFLFLLFLSKNVFDLCCGRQRDRQAVEGW